MYALPMVLLRFTLLPEFSTMKSASATLFMTVFDVKLILNSLSSISYFTIIHETFGFCRKFLIGLLVKNVILWADIWT